MNKETTKKNEMLERLPKTFLLLKEIFEKFENNPPSSESSGESK